jgi:hypothetical protein
VLPEYPEEAWNDRTWRKCGVGLQCMLWSVATYVYVCSYLSLIRKTCADGHLGVACPGVSWLIHVGKGAAVLTYMCMAGRAQSPAA